MIVMIKRVVVFIYNAPVPVPETNSKHSTTSHQSHTAKKYLHKKKQDLANTIAYDQTMVMND